MLWAILKYSIGSLLYGGLITILFIALFIFLIKGWYKDAVFKPVSYVVLAILSLIILYNSVIICGALAMKSDLDSIRGFIENIIAYTGIDLDGIVDSASGSDVVRQLVSAHPILNYYADSGEFYGMTFSELPAAICDTLNSYLNGVIVEHLLWSLGFVVVAAVIVIKTMRRESAHRISSMGRTSRRSDGWTVTSRNNRGRRRTSRI